MPVACDPQSITTDARCFTCLGEKSLVAMQVYLLGQILLAADPMADISPQALATASRCYLGCMSGKGLIAAQVYLLCQIAGGGGGGPGTDYIVWQDTGPTPAGPPADQTKPWVMYFRSGHAAKVWDPNNLIWR